MNKRELFDAAHDAKRLILEALHRHGVTAFGRDDDPNPFFGQVDGGLLLEMSYRTPAALLTPWGKWDVTGGCSYSPGQADAAMAELTQTLDLVEVEPVVERLLGPYGPVMSIGAVGDRVMHAATHRARADYVGHAAAHEEWRSLSEEVCDE